MLLGGALAGELATGAAAADPGSGSSGVGSPGSSGAAPAGSFVLGTAQAVSQAIVLAPATGGLGYDITLAQSLAGYTEGVAQGQSQTLDLGAIGLSLTSTQCNGQPAVVPGKELPAPVTVESGASGQQQQTQLTQGLNGTGAGAGQEQAAASPTPQSSATTTLVGWDVPGGFSIDGATATATSAVVDGDARVAQASSAISSVSLLGGLVTLDGLHWTATQRTGAGAANQGSFTIGGVTVAGVTVPVPAGPLAQVAAIVDTALAPTGFHVTFPTTSVDASTGTVTETPLSVGIDNSALGHQVVGPQLGTVQPLRDAIDKALLGASCQAGIPLLLADIGTGVVAGGGSLDLEIGGAQAGTTDQAAVDPFGGLGLGGGLGGLLGATVGGLGSGGGSAGGLGTGPLGATGGGAAGPAGAAGGARALPTRVVTTVACRSLAGGGGGCHGPGNALPVGLAGLGALVAVAAADVVRLRRHRQLQAVGS